MIDFSTAENAGLYGAQAARWRSIEDAAHRHGITVVHFDACGLAERGTLLAALGRVCHFPAWYAANFDALHDCLTDPDWLPASGYLLLLGGLATLERQAPNDFVVLLDVLGSAAEVSRQLGRRFWAVVDATGTSLPPPPEA